MYDAAYKNFLKKFFKLKILKKKFRLKNGKAFNLAKSVVFVNFDKFEYSKVYLHL